MHLSRVVFFCCGKFYLPVWYLLHLSAVKDRSPFVISHRADRISGNRRIPVFASLCRCSIMVICVFFVCVGEQWTLCIIGSHVFEPCPPFWLCYQPWLLRTPSAAFMFNLTRVREYRLFELDFSSNRRLAELLSGCVQRGKPALSSALPGRPRTCQRLGQTIACIQTSTAGSWWLWTTAEALLFFRFSHQTHCWKELVSN